MTYAEQFIAEQKARFEEMGVTGMTRRQRARVKNLDVVSALERHIALEIAADMPSTLGPAPHGDSGQMRVLNMLTGEIREQRAPKRQLDIDLDEIETELAGVAI